MEKPFGDLVRESFINSKNKKLGREAHFFIFYINEGQKYLFLIGKQEVGREISLNLNRIYIFNE